MHHSQYQSPALQAHSLLSEPPGEPSQYWNGSVFLVARLFHQTISCMSVKWRNWGGAVPEGLLSGRSGCLFIFSALKIHGQSLIFPVLNLKTVFWHVFCTWTPQEKYHRSLIKWKVRGFLWAMHVSLLCDSYQIWNCISACGFLEGERNTDIAILFGTLVCVWLLDTSDFNKCQLILCK